MISPLFARAGLALFALPGMVAFVVPALLLDADRSSRFDLVGLERGQVLALLGPPDDTDKWREWDSVYWPGPERGFIPIDSEWLVLRFDPSGRVATYDVVAD